LKHKDSLTGIKIKSKNSLTGYELNNKKTAHEPFFVQTLLKPKKDELFFVMESCIAIINEKNLITLYEKILTETMKSLCAKKGAFYLYVQRDESFEIINCHGIIEKGLSEWEEISEPVINELQVNNSAFYGISNDRKVDVNSLIIPIYYEEKLYAVVKLAENSKAGKFSKHDIDVANQMINFINAAIESMKASSKDGDETLRLHNKKSFKLNYFYEFISNELRRARRYQKTFSLIYFKMENFHLIKKKIKKSTVKKYIETILDKLNLTIRETDFIAEESESKYFIVLPETDYFGSLMTMRKIESNITEDMVIKEDKNSFPVSIKMSSASFPKDGVNAKSILKALSTRLEIAKDSISEKLDMKNTPFWDLLLNLIGDEDEYSSDSIGSKKFNTANLDDGGQDKQEGITFTVFHPQTIRQLENVIFFETAINTERKGVIYVGNSDAEHTFNIFKKLPDLEYSKSRISLITRQCIKEILFPNLTYIFTNEEVMSNFYFIIYLNEKYAYGLFTKRNEVGDYYGFHTSDSIFIENLIVKLQNHYMLQEQL
jgi:diguanylate cyclase (GGDEF)-like protein